MQQPNEIIKYAVPKNFYSGTSGLVLPVPNKNFFPDDYKNRSRLSYYASLFNSIEVNSSFYRIPRPATTANWAADVPENFRFTFKIYKEITHGKDAELNEEIIRQFMFVIDQVTNKKGCLLIQFPPKTNYSLSMLEQLLKKISVYNPERRWKLCVEFRDQAWYNSETFSLLREHSASLVIQDIPKSITPEVKPWTDFVYIRFHGTAGDYRGSYELLQLQVYAKKIHQWLKEGMEVYAYFNNTIGDAVKNLQTLNMLLNRV